MTPLDADLTARLRAVRLCVFDADGTLLDDRHEVADVTRDAVDAARASGLEVLLASSRSPNAMRTILGALGGAAPFVGSQGAVLGRFPDGPGGSLEVLDHRPAPLAESLEVLDLATAAGVSVSWHTPDRWLVVAEDEAVVREARITGCTPTRLDRSALADTPGSGAGPDKLMLISDPDDVSALERIARSVPAGLQAQFSNPNYLEITADGVDKASAVERYCTPREIGLATVLAMGDGLNDLGMLRLAGVSAAPGNARPQVLESVDLVCETNDRHGVAELLTTLVALRDG